MRRSAWFACWLLAAAPAAADDAVSARLALLTLKALSFDQAFHGDGQSFRVGVATCDADGAAIVHGFEAAAAVRVKGERAEVREVPCRAGALEGLSVLFIAGGPADVVRALARAAVAQGVRTFTSDAALLGEGIAVAFVASSSGFEIHVHPVHAEAQGMSFSLPFLRAANLVNPERPQ